MKRTLPLLIFFVLSCAPLTNAINASDFHEVLGYTVLACTNASGELEGADFDKIVKLDNGMIFEFHTYSYFYAYHPDVVVFAKSVQYGGKSVIVYKLLIEDEDEFFDVTRIR